MRNAMLINEKDNVIVAIEPLSKGTNAVYQVNGRSEEIKVLEDIPMYHKIARVPIKAGSEIIKYVSTLEKRLVIFRPDRMCIHITF